MTFYFVSDLVLKRYDKNLEPQERFADNYLSEHGVFNRKCGGDVLIGIPETQSLPAIFHEVMNKQSDGEYL